MQYIKPVGFILARETVLDFGEYKELAYTPMPGLGVFQDTEGVYSAIKELELPLGWVCIELSRVIEGVIRGEVV